MCIRRYVSNGPRIIWSWLDTNRFTSQKDMHKKFTFSFAATLTFRPSVCSPVTLSSAQSNVNRSVSNQDQTRSNRHISSNTFSSTEMRHFCPICSSHTFLSTKLEVSMTFLLRVNQKHGRTDGQTDGRVTTFNAAS